MVYLFLPYSLNQSPHSIFMSLSHEPSLPHHPTPNSISWGWALLYSASLAVYSLQWCVYLISLYNLSSPSLLCHKPHSTSISAALQIGSLYHFSNSIYPKQYSVCFSPTFFIQHMGSEFILTTADSYHLLCFMASNTSVVYRYHETSLSICRLGIWIASTSWLFHTLLAPRNETSVGRMTPANEI